MKRASLLLLAAWVVQGCSSGHDGASNPATTVPATTPLIPDSCVAGSMPVLASGACEPVGVTACAAGFEASASGWGCSPILPASPCTGATRAVLGRSSCVPLDDCAAAFPPKGAVVVHDDASLKSALAGVADGATIALDSGTYAAIEVPGDFRNLHLVGRCADKVHLVGTGQRGVFVSGADISVSVESMTIEGFQAGLVAAWGAGVTASKVVIRNAQLGVTAGGDAAKVSVTGSVIERTTPLTGAVSQAITAQATGKVTIEDVDVRGVDSFVQAVEAKTAVVIRRSVLTHTADVVHGSKILALANSDISIEESAVVTRKGTLVFVGRELLGVAATTTASGGSVHLKNSTASQSGKSLDAPLMSVDDGGRLDVSGTTIEHRATSAIMVGHVGSKVAVTGSVIRGLVSDDKVHNAVWVLRGGSAEIGTSAVVNAQENALIVNETGSQLTLTRSLVHDTYAGSAEADPRFGSSGLGVLAANGGTLSMKESAVVASRTAGVLVGASAQAEISDSIVDKTLFGPEGGSAGGIIAIDARVVVEGAFVRDSQDAALVFVGGQGIVKRSHFVHNPVGLHLSETTLVNASSDPVSSDEVQVVFFANVFEGTDVPVRDAPYAAPPVPSAKPLGN